MAKNMESRLSLFGVCKMQLKVQDFSFESIQLADVSWFLSMGLRVQVGVKDWNGQ